MSKSLTIKKFAKGGLTALLTPIVVSVAFSVFFPICVVLALSFAPVFAYKIFASLHRTQKLPRLQVNKTFPPIPFEFVDTDKSISKPAKVFLSVGVLFAFMILSPCILLYEIAVGFYASLLTSQDAFKKLKKVIYGSTEIDNSVIQKGKIDNDPKVQSLEAALTEIDNDPNVQSLGFNGKAVLKMFCEVDFVVNTIKSHYSESELEKNGMKKHIDEFYRVKNVCSIEFLRKCTSEDDIGLNEFDKSLRKMRDFVLANECFPKGSECWRKIFVNAGGTFISFYLCLCGEHERLARCDKVLTESCEKLDTSVQKGEGQEGCVQQDKLSAEPSKKLDNANQSPAVDVRQSSVLK